MPRHPRPLRYLPIPLIVLGLLLAGRGLAQPNPTPPAQPGRLTLATYNLENFHDVFDDPYTKDEDSGIKPRAEIEALARTIRWVNADIFAFQELENDGALRAVVNEFLADMGYRYIAVQPTNSDRGINLGVISRLPIVSLTSHRFLECRLEGESRTWEFARDLMQVRVRATPDRNLDLFIVHLKSRHDSAGDPMSAKWRSAEAATAVRIIEPLLQADPDAWLAVAGDFNDTPGSPAIGRFLAPSPVLGSQPMLIDTHASLPAEKRITYRKEPYARNGPIDYVLASPGLARHLVPGSARVPLTHDHPDMLTGSDHAPVIVSFDLPPRH